RELPVPALVGDGADEERRPQHRQLRRPALRRAVRAAQGSRERRRARGADPRGARPARARAALDRALPPRGLRARAPLARGREADGPAGAGLEVLRGGRRAPRARARGLERAGALAGAGAGRAGAGGVRAGRRDLAAGAARVTAWLVRRLLWGLLTLLGVLGFLFVLFFATAEPDDIARRALGEKAPPEAIAQWIVNHGY